MGVVLLWSSPALAGSLLPIMLLPALRYAVMRCDPSLNCLLLGAGCRMKAAAAEAEAVGAAAAGAPAEAPDAAPEAAASVPPVAVDEGPGSSDAQRRRGRSARVPLGYL